MRLRGRLGFVVAKRPGANGKVEFHIGPLVGRFRWKDSAWSMPVEAGACPGRSLVRPPLSGSFDEEPKLRIFADKSRTD
jgi:hypothetical protein